MRKLSLIILLELAFILISGRLHADSPHGKDFKLNCNLCHSSSGWKLDKSIYSFDHNKTDFALTGQHEELGCRSCHPTLIFSEAQTGCVDCHTDLHEQTVGPDCGRCHTPKSWIVENITEIHQRSRFPLLGPHNTADCNQCHPSASLLRYEPRGVECYDCHQADYEATANPNHVQGGYSKSCIECHSMNQFDWTGSGFTHAFFPLTEGHSLVTCEECHINGDYSKRSKECVSCHQTQYNTTTNPNHVAANIPTSCTDCHTTSQGWQTSTFPIHDNYYPLTGGHALVAENCTGCHNDNYNNTPNTCVGCHQAKFNNTTNPNHIEAEIPATCETCHTTDPGWKPATFPIHNNNYPLTGAHTTADCNSCHVGGNYNDTPTTCAGCHQANYNNTTNPKHGEAGIPLTCEDCHTTDPGWKPATFPIHNTNYPLTGAHTTVDCNSCHVGGNFNNTPNTCIGCHQANYNQSVNPNHGALGIPTTCETCHTTNPGWAPATFPIHVTYYPLTGAHSTVDCNSCHEGGNYNNTPITCVGCHQANYNNTTNPNHLALGLPTTCDECHTTNPGWTPATFAIHNNYYQLTGAHTTVDCNSCHPGGNYNNTPTTCVGCHQANYNQSVNPNHGALGIPTTCETCHTTVPDWQPATFPIHNNYYVLQGAHLSVDCFTCHQGNFNNNIPTTCFGCHQTDYNQTTNPNHAAAQFPTDCLLCHTQNAWVPSTFNHDGQYFPIYSGEHQGEWNLCSDCHTNPTNFQIFSCIDCHEHNQTAMAEEHNGVSGYVWNSNACYSCHPDGESDGKLQNRIRQQN